MERSIQIRYHQASYQIACDGEIYNLHTLYQQLKSEYPLKEVMEEVIFFAWYKWGDDAYQHLEGAYSFAIVDDESCMVIKDPLGLRPIFYCAYQKHIYISNSIKTIMEESSIPLIVTREGILNLFSFGPGIPEDQTLYSGIKALPMGCRMQIEHHDIHVENYYRLPIYQHVDSLEQTIQTIHDLLEQSILAQMPDCHANFLSGGLDSSIITSVCAKHDHNWRTYSLDYEGNKENFIKNDFQTSMDNAFIEEMIARFRCQHKYLEIDQSTLASLLEEAMFARDHPGMADIDASLLWLCQQVADDESIILSGECSDEIFGGYPWFYREDLATPGSFPWLRYFDHRIELLHEDLRDLPFQDHIQQQYQKSVEQIRFLPTDTIEDRHARIQTNLCLHWFMQTLVTRQVCEGDRANMNIRAPFANVKLLEYVYNIPWKMKFYDQQEKGILRKAFEQDLPANICWRKKNPFPKTHNPVYADIIAGMLKERVEDPSSPLHILFNKEKLWELIETKGASYTLPWYGQLMSGPQLLAYLYQIDRWINKYQIIIQI